MAAHELTGFAHVGIRVAELSRSREFYERLGFRYVMGPFDNEPVVILDHPSGITINLIINATTEGDPNVLMDVPEKHPGFTHISFFVKDLKATERVLLDASVVITEGPLTFPDGTRALFVRDPDGNVIELDQRPLPS